MNILKNKQSFFYKLLMSYLLVGVLPVIIFCLFATFFTYNQPMKILSNQSLQAANESLDSLDEMLEGYKTVLTLFAEDDMVLDLLASNDTGESSRNVAYQKMFTLLSGKVTDSDMYLIKENGEFIVAATPDNEKYDLSKMKEWGIFRILNETDEAFTYPNCYKTADGKDISMSVAKKITVDGKVVGYVILDIPKSTVEKNLNASSTFPELNYIIMDHNFYIMYDEVDTVFQPILFAYDFRSELLDKKEDIRLVNIQDRDSLLCNVNSAKNDMILVAVAPVGNILQNNKYILLMTPLVALFSIILCFLLTVNLTGRISKPIKEIVQAMEKVEKGDIHTRVAIQGGDDEISYMARRFNEMVESINDLFQKNMEKQDRLRFAEIKSLQAQINPHFLYNTLDSIKWLAKLNGVEEISVIVSKLGKLLKSSINNYDDLATVKESMFLIDSYLSIQKIRFDNKFDVEVDIDESIMQCLIPKLLLQPVVENAIVHGVENKIGKSIVKIVGKIENDCIIFEVEDDGVGMGEEKLEELRDSVALENATENIALSNIHNRIKLYYGDKYGLEIFSKKDRGTRVRITIPINNACTPKEDVINDTNSDSGR